MRSRRSCTGAEAAEAVLPFSTAAMRICAVLSGRLPRLISAYFRPAGTDTVCAGWPSMTTSRRGDAIVALKQGRALHTPAAMRSASTTVGEDSVNDSDSPMPSSARPSHQRVLYAGSSHRPDRRLFDVKSGVAAA